MPETQTQPDEAVNPALVAVAAPDAISPISPELSPSAAPVAIAAEPEDSHDRSPHRRDALACASLVGLLVANQHAVPQPDERLAARAYRLADAMIDASGS